MSAPAKIVRRVHLGVGHLRTGNTRHFHGGELVSTPAALIIVQFGSSQFNLIHLDKAENEMTDTFHDSIEDAFKQAEFEFRVGPDDWAIVEEAYS